MTVTDACAPALPPVSMSIGTHAISTVLIALSRDSNLLMISPVNVALIIRIKSHRIRF